MPEITINNFSCHYRHHQKENAPCIVFLNGIMSPLESWQAQEQLAHRLGFSTLQYEYRGQWRSEVSQGPYSMQTHVDDLHALMQALGIQQAHLVGTSYGGMVGMKFASQNPDRVLSLMVIATTARIRPLPGAILANWQSLCSNNDVRGLFRAFLPDLYSEQFLVSNQDFLSQRLVSLEKALQELPDFCAGQSLLNQAQFPELSDGSLVKRLPDIRCRTLVIAAEEDRLYPPSDSAEIVRQIKKAQLLVIGGAGHAAVMEQPEAINQLLTGHLLAAEENSIR